MRIVFTENFDENLIQILDFISQDSIQRAVEFHSQLYDKIASIADMPYRFRKNKTMDKESIRDLIFKGYIVVFEISKDSIRILSIFKHNNPKNF
ncbi:type II toxin-antitoxin system RelE/ParE family toxin [Campylobacter mucosalis]|uniref:Toxin-antitoxin system, toxin component, RelE/ParE family n=1 Tax=Campylobacter mucosalis CCUG 21559 TaxID=1032067 RepID=A0A6G5QGK0_9BACT|nr:type II toxin-antitoxin system RelE/ParE family toxin [Campylobacter mucosalis]KEA46224.1 plasmid stabilization protein [Campylobacter mucosalis]QCD44771.1 toxin-antitoxin system, toxin component, RelE/ParE family [Campylobacter mucosalis CCUG 21559]QKF62682.1 toxin-antitoxin system, toxin component, RelE/ParE family [Campylobacter mucosalis]